MFARLLCIEDDADTRELLADALTSRGFEVQTACDGEDGHRAILGDRPDLVMCDVMLPGLSGFDLLKLLTESRSDDIALIPFIFLTALDDRNSILQGRRLGADDYVTKPIDFDILAEIVKRRLGVRNRGGDSQAVLSRRELEVLTWVARGKSSTDIATLLSLSDRTVDYHVENAMRKLRVGTRVQAAVAAARARLIRV